ncbi:MAG: chemotaxis protein CheA, partial [Gammaproteobacteria bacterium]
MGDNLRRWHADPGDREVRQLLMRELHTLKGSARMAGAMDLGQRVHEMETRVEAAANQGVAPIALIEALISAHDRIVDVFESIGGSPLPMRASGSGAGRQPAMAATPIVPDGGRDASGSAATSAEAASATGASGADALVRVRADLLDSLVTGSGEASIARSRVEDELERMRESLQDLTENVGRLRGQLRELEIQGASRATAAGVDAGANPSGFDPLELDRYTRFQELARLLAESVDDVATVQQSAMRNLDRATEDLGRQRQVLRELQQNVMRMRMVRFDSIADRLHRVARQAAEAVHKRVDLKLGGAAVEIDRSVLERMAAPIEHLLRNAVVHGIEAPAARLAAGKAETGEIRLHVRHEGNEVVLVFEDDGLGLDHARITARARANGVVGPDDHVPESQAAELIFEPGFSTAEAIDEISGRGVGLDVVRAEVEALGGHIALETTPGQGSRFTLQLPLTTAVMQVLLLRCGEATVAVPAALVD